MNEAHIVNPEGLLPRGMSDFAKMVQQKRCFVDKSLLIQEILYCDDDVVLLTRPRRFGKTINLSMLRYFFETLSHDSTDSTGQSRLFDGLLIAQDQQALQHQGKYPVISLTFKDIKATSWPEAYKDLCSVIGKEIDRHPECKQFDIAGFGDEERRQWTRILSPDQAEQSDWKNALQLLCKLLTLHHKQSVWLCLDEYDTPIHQAYMQSQQDKSDIRNQGSYYSQMITFMRALFGRALKGNDPFLHKAVITGILRVAKEDIFSDLNNLGVYGVMDDRFARFFGFTPAEVQQLLQQRQLQHTLTAVSQWYDGYLFGEDRPVTIYNPWSVVSYVANPTRHPKEYWVNTGSTGLIEHLVDKSSTWDKQAIETLLRGQTIERDVADNLPLRELQKFGEGLWSIVLTSGYVTAVDTIQGVIGKQATLRVPNQEVHIAFQRMVKSWLKEIPSNALPEMLQALLAGNTNTFSQKLNTLLLCNLSFYDTAASENSYHLFILGLLSHLSGNYKVRSNRESGLGRPDLLLIPMVQDARLPGIVMEFKIADAEDQLQQAAHTALQQIEQKKYAAEFQDYPPPRIIRLGIAFCNKKAAVASACKTSNSNPKT
ncbi:MAG: AAA family ATPase [Myxococcota bacterium]